MFNFWFLNQPTFAAVSFVRGYSGMEMYFQWQEQGVHTGGHFED
jgi:hypothetical protein